MEQKGIGNEIREWLLSQLSLTGHKKRIRAAMGVIDSSMVADRSIVVRGPGGDEVITVADHRIRLMGASLVVNIYGLEAEKRNRTVVVGDPDAPLMINQADRRYLEQALVTTSD